MEECIQYEKEKNKYCTPMVDIYALDVKDILCMSNEENDNDFDAGDM